MVMNKDLLDYMKHLVWMNSLINQEVEEPVLEFQSTLNKIKKDISKTEDPHQILMHI